MSKKGGANIYSFVVNDGVNRIDALGLQTIPVPPPYELPTTIKPTLLPPFDQNVNIDLGLPWEPQPKSLPPLGPTIPDVDYEKNVRTYNCAGLAFRTYTPMSETDALGKLRKGTKIDCAKGRCWCGQVKCRYFKFTVRTLARNINTGKWTVGPIWPEPDWHVSCGSGKSCPEKYAKGNINHGDPDNFGKGSIIWNHTTGGADYYYKIVSIIKKRMLLRQC